MMDPVSITVGAVAALAAISATVSAMVPNLVTAQPGFSVIYDGGDEFDLVFIHGPELRRWTAGKTDIFRSIRSVSTSKWLRGPFKTHFPNARTMLYEYSIDLSNLEYLSQILKVETERLLEHLVRLRTSDPEPRPLIFLTHGIGGLLAKNALAGAAEAIVENERVLKMIHIFTAGVIFFDLPSRDQNQKSFEGPPKAAAMSELDLTERQMSNVKLEAELLDLQVQRYKSVERNIHNYSFRELRSDGSAKSRKKQLIKDEQSLKPGEGGWCFKTGSLKTLMLASGGESEEYDKLRSCIGKSLSHAKATRDQNMRLLAPLDTIQPSINTTTFRQQTKSVRRAITTDRVLVGAIHLSKNQNYNDAEEVFFSEIRRLETPSNNNQVTSPAASLSALEELARHYVRKGDFEKAELVFKRIYVALQESHSTPWVPKAAEQIDKAAQACEAQGRYQEAAVCLERARLIHSKTGGDENPFVLNIEARLASLYDNQSQLEKAQELYEHLYEVRKRQVANGQGLESLTAFLMVRENQAMSLVRGRQYDTAEQQLQEVLEHRKIMLLDRGDRGNQADLARALETTVHRIEAIYKLHGRDDDIKKLLDKYAVYFDEKPRSVNAPDVLDPIQEMNVSSKLSSSKSDIRSEKDTDTDIGTGK